MQDPLGEIGRNERCWCGSSRKYKNCHGGVRARSVPGESTPPDDDEYFWISPNTRMRRGGIGLAAGGAPIYAPEETPTARSRPLPPGLAEIFRTQRPVAILTVKEAACQRFEMLDSMGLRRSEDAGEMSQVQLDEIYDASIDYALATLIALQSAKVSEQPPVVVYSDDENAERTAIRVALWAHHVCIPDTLFAAAIHDRDLEHARSAVRDLLGLKALIQTGLVVPVPQECAEAISRPAILKATNNDLSDPALSAWVKQQLILEGPTARETINITAKDDLQEWPFFRTYGRITSVEDDGNVQFHSFGHYDEKWDYSSWIDQVRSEALAHYVQEVNSEVANADFLGGTYLTRSRFRAQLLRQKGASDSIAHSLLWTEVPLISTGNPVELARVASNDAAVEDLRRRISVAVRSCTDMSEMIPKIDFLKEDLDHEARELKKQISRSKAWTGLSLGLALSTVAMGGVDFLWLLAASSTIATARTFVPYFEKRASQKDQAAWIFHSLRSE